MKVEPRLPVGAVVRGVSIDHEVPVDHDVPPIGVVGAATKATFDVAVDDVLLMFTDGLVERRDRSIDDRMAELGAFVHEHVREPCSTIAELVMDEFADQPDDDVAVLVLRPRNHRSEEYRLQQRIRPTASVRFA